MRLLVAAIFLVLTANVLCDTIEQDVNNSMKVKAEIQELLDVVLEPSPVAEFLEENSGEAMPPPVPVVVKQQVQKQSTPQKVAAPPAQEQPKATQKSKAPPVQNQKSTVEVVPAPSPSAPAANKLSKAMPFNRYVTEVSALLDQAMHGLKMDKSLWTKASQDGKEKRAQLKSKALGAKQDAGSDVTKINAIETHMTLAQKKSAQAYIKFASNFRAKANHEFWKKYHLAEAKQGKLTGLFSEITSHVAHAVTAMRQKQEKVEEKYIDSLKSFYKVNYKTKYSRASGKVDKKQIKLDKQKVKDAKASMKKAHAALIEFKKNLQTAKHHGHKLRKRLLKAQERLRHVFKKARRAMRGASKTFHAGFDSHFSAQQTVSKKALKNLLIEKQLHTKKESKNSKKDLKVTAKTVAKALKSAGKAGKVVVVVSKSDDKEEKEEKEEKAKPSHPTHKAKQDDSDAKKAKLKTAAIRAVNMVKKAAKAILGQTNEHVVNGKQHPTSKSSVHAKPVKKHAKSEKPQKASHTGKVIIVTDKADSPSTKHAATAKQAENQAVSIVKDAILRAQELHQVQDDEVVPEK